MLYIIVLNWNLKLETEACLHSLLESGFEQEQIILVDNGSTDDSAQYIKQKFEKIHLLTNTANIGYSAGNNLGIRFAQKVGAEWILLLNNDTIVARNFAETTQKTLSKNYNYALFTPVIFYYDKPRIVWSMGDRIIPGTLLTTGLFKNKTLPDSTPSVVPVDFATGCALLVKRDVFTAIQGFDESLFMYAEDMDFCQRARSAGFNIACMTEAHVYHKVSRSSDQVQPRTLYLRVKNQNIFYKKYSKGPQSLLMILLSFLLALRTVIKKILTGDFELVSPVLHGWVQGWFNDAREG